jgi:hypothetical protein
MRLQFNPLNPSASYPGSGARAGQVIFARMFRKPQRILAGEPTRLGWLLPRAADREL